MFIKENLCYEFFTATNNFSSRFKTITAVCVSKMAYRGESPAAQNKMAQRTETSEKVNEHTNLLSQKFSICSQTQKKPRKNIITSYTIEGNC